GKGAQSADRSNDTLAGGLEVLQRGNEGVPGESTVSGSRFPPEARHRGRPEICDGLRRARPRPCRPRVDRTCGGECSQGLRAAGWCQRSGKLLRHFHLPPAVNQKPGTLSTDLGIVDAKIPQGPLSPRILVGLYIARDWSLRQSRGRRSKGDRTRS